MPELPEVETVVRYLRPLLVGRTFASVSLPAQYKKAIANCPIRSLNMYLNGQTITDVSRRAKFIVIHCDAGILCIHLRMTGRVLLTPPTHTERKYITATFNMTDGESFYFKDVRKFGRIYWYTDTQEFDSKLGIEPLSAAYTAARLTSLLATRKRAIKPLLLDQSCVVGIGNIYADEILWASAIHPTASANTLPASAVKRIHANTKRILRASIKMNGTTFQSFYYGEEASGEFKSMLQVFGKQGTPCPRCTTLIEKTVVAQRGTHYCPCCQQL
jgi:formamidopyrimidine-DNA glycosylase